MVRDVVLAVGEKRLWFGDLCVQTVYRRSYWGTFVPLDAIPELEEKLFRNGVSGVYEIFSVVVKLLEVWPVDTSIVPAP
jgi:hypothetical protein